MLRRRLVVVEFHNAGGNWDGFAAQVGATSLSAVALRRRYVSAVLERCRYTTTLQDSGRWRFLQRPRFVRQPLGIRDSRALSHAGERDSREHPRSPTLRGNACPSD